MVANSLVQARINADIKADAQAVLEAMGLTVSDAVRLMLTKVAEEKKLPFDLLRPNQTTIDAMKAARAGEVIRHETVNSLMKDLNEGD